MSWLLHHLQTWSYYIAFGTDCIGIIVALYFIIDDYALYAPSSRHNSLFFITLAMCIWVGISYCCFTHNAKTVAMAMAWIPAMPMLGYALMLAVMIIGKPDFK